MGLNPDGNINVKYTLMALRNKLMENVEMLNKLLEKTDYITGIFATDYDSVAICVSSQEEMDDMLKNDLIRNEIIDEEPEEDDEISSESDNETHSDRLRMMKNLIFSSESKQMSDSDDESSENDFVDIVNMQGLIHKYNDLIGDGDEETD